jgi:hypothetical protein
MNGTIAQSAIRYKEERGFSPASNPAAKRRTALPKAGAKSKGRSDCDALAATTVANNEEPAHTKQSGASAPLCKTPPEQPNTNR